MENEVTIKHDEFMHKIASESNGRVVAINFNLSSDILTWLMENIGLPKVDWVVKNTIHLTDNTLGGIAIFQDPNEGITFLFKNKTDATAFKLRWQ